MSRKKCGKRRNCLLQEISPFPKVFSKDVYSTHQDSFGKGLMTLREEALGKHWEKNRTTFYLTSNLFFSNNVFHVTNNHDEESFEKVGIGE